MNKNPLPAVHIGTIKNYSETSPEFVDSLLEVDYDFANLDRPSNVLHFYKNDVVVGSLVMKWGLANIVPTGNFRVGLNNSKIEPSIPKPYSKYFRDVENLSEIDVYMVHHLFGVHDPSGALQHASKKLLLPGTRTGGKSRYKDIKEARDTLNRWLEINKEQENE